jgi:RimJ/RimL family protein N-acetyltransferase
MLPRVRQSIMLRRFALSDLADFQSYRYDPHVGLYQGWLPMPDEAASEFLQEVSAEPLLQLGRWTQIAIASATTEQLLGDIGICVAVDERQAEIGFTLAQVHQGQSFATLAVLEAIEFVLEHTTVQRIVAITDARNVRSIRLLERVGMSLETVAAATFRGEPCIEYTYCLARPPSDA